MNISFFNCVDDNRKLNKNLTNEILTIGNLRENCNSTNPELYIEHTVNILNSNYAYISDFHRYYFISEITTDANGLYIVKLRCDVLMSYKNDILNLNIIATRNTDYFNLYLNDEKLKTLSYPRMQAKAFPQTPFDLNNIHFLLTVAGG